MDKVMIKLELDVDQLNLVLAALGKLPLEQSVDVFMAVRTQAQGQLQQQQVKELPAE